MRVLRLDDLEAGRPSLELHPYLTVVFGLSDDARARMVDTLAAIAAGDDPGIGGLVESHGLLLDLDRGTLDVLDLDSDLDVVVRQADLPSDDPSTDGMADRSDHPDGSVDERAVVAMAEARRAHETLRAAVEELRLQRDEALDRVARTSGTLSAADGEEGNHTGEAFDELLRRRAELTAAVTTLRTPDVPSVEDALVAVQAHHRLPPEAIAIGRELARVEKLLDDLERRLEADGIGPIAANRRLEAALAEVRRLEEAKRPKEHDPADVQELERAHDRVREAERGATGRLSGRRADRTLEEALESEQSVLDRLGFPTYTAVVMSITAPTVDDDARLRLPEARQAVVDAEEAMAGAAEELERHPERITLVETADGLRQRAIPIVGEVDSRRLVAALRGTDAADRPGPADADVATLRFALEQAGVDFGDLGLTGSEVVEIAEVWLVEMDEAATEREGVEAELADVEELLVAGTPDPQLETAIENERVLADRLDAQELLLDAAAGAALAAAERVERSELSSPSAEQPGDRARTNESDDPAAVLSDDVEWALLARIAAQRSVSHAGSVPLVIDDALVGRQPEEVTALLGELERMADAVQVIYLTGDPDIAEWAAASDEARVGLIRTDE